MAPAADRLQRRRRGAPPPRRAQLRAAAGPSVADQRPQRVRPPTATPAPAAARAGAPATGSTSTRRSPPPPTPAPVPCTRPHTAMTYAVGTLDTVVDGHLLAVDSRRVQAQVGADCPRRLPSFLGGTPDDLRLSMLRAVWFTPTVEESDAGADWFRCDVIAVAGRRRLAPLTGPLAGVLGPAGGPRPLRHVRHRRARHRGLPRVDLLQRPHLAGDPRPSPLSGRATVPRRGQRCARPASRSARTRPAAPPPTSSTSPGATSGPPAQQWAGRPDYGLCWVPD